MVHFSRNANRVMMAVAICFATNPAIAQSDSDALTFRQVLFSLIIGGGNGNDVMGGPFASVVSPDGNDVYVSAYLARGVAHFQRDQLDGTLEFVGTTPTLLPNQPELVSPYGLAISSNGKFLYAAVTNGGAFGTFGGIVRYDRSLNTGELTLGGGLPADGAIVPGIHNPKLIAVSPDGRHVYVLSDSLDVAPYYSASLAVISTDPLTGAMAFAKKIDLSNNLPPSPAGDTFAATIADIAVSPDGNNVYVARAFNESLDAYTRDAATGELAFLGATYLRASPRGFVRSVAVSTDGKHVYATEGMGGTVYLLDRASDGSLSVRSGTGEPLLGAGDTLVSPDGARVYVSAQWIEPNDLPQLNAYIRDTGTGELTLLETIVDGVTGFRVFYNPGLAAISPDSAHLYLPGLTNSSLSVFSVDRPDLPCQDFPVIDSEFAALATAYDFYEDLDFDGLPETAALALLEEASCANTDDAFDEAMTNAYLFDYASVTNELGPEQTAWVPYRHAIAALASMSVSMRVYLNEAFAPFELELQPYYVSVSCDETACEPANTRGLPSSELLSGAGDPDQDGFTNAEEWANVLARGGSVREFGVSALDASNDGSTVVSFSSGSSSGSCFIATAAYGTPLAAELDTLREFRDRDLLTNALGAGFTDAYYRLSPPVAEFIGLHPCLRTIMRLALGPILDVIR